MLIDPLEVIAGDGIRRAKVVEGSRSNSFVQSAMRSYPPRSGIDRFPGTTGPPEAPAADALSPWKRAVQASVVRAASEEGGHAPGGTAREKD